MGHEIPNNITKESILIAPCKPEGEAVTLDEESRDGQCLCGDFRCLIDKSNIVIQKDRIPSIELQQVR